MAENSRSRVTAEAAFLKTQNQSMSRERALSETDAFNQARDANTARLKELRLEKEALERAAEAISPKPTARRRKLSV
ncbi:hypothetical protein [Bosea sp. (in: a-proteobacteria)]|uniref:hypothetical protein n=1 Tax=Bosea sp. (in: a-proteobacteria) TaxID=1871050 RepID=UPI002FC7BAC3